MKIQICSDLHLEMRSDYQLKLTDSDIIILAGDIAVGLDGLKFAISQSQLHNKKVIYLAGNHEFYHHDYSELLTAIRELAKQYEQVHFLELDELIIDDVRFLGTTLWTDYLGNGSDSRELNMSAVESALNDHRLIRNTYRHFTTEDALTLNKAAKKWLTHKLAEPFSGKTVVITHHAPSLICQHPHFQYSPIATGFLSDMDGLVAKADMWVFGHTHANVDTHIGKCRLISNQAGYPMERVPVAFKPEWVIEL
jgi:predicted phosphodiesterase